MSHQAIFDKASDLAYTTAGTTAGLGILGWISDNHQLIASLGILLGGVLGIITAYVNWRYRSRENTRQEERHSKLMEKDKDKDVMP